MSRSNNLPINDNCYETKYPNEFFRRMQPEKEEFLVFRKWPTIKGSKFVISYLPSEEDQNIEIEIENHKIEIPPVLKSIALEIEEAKELLDYKINWDNNNGEPTNEKTFLKAINFLQSYAKNILKNYNAVLSRPFINIMNDGSIYIQWNTNKAFFTIIFKKQENKFSYFFAEQKDNNRPWKSAVDNNEFVEEIIARWMTKYLSDTL